MGPSGEDLMTTLDHLEADQTTSPAHLEADQMTSLDHLEADLENIQGHLGADQTTIEDQLEEDQRINQDHSEEDRKTILDLSEAGQIIIQDHLAADLKTTRVPLEADPAIPHLGIPSLEDPMAWDLRVRFEAEGKTIPVPDSSREVLRQRIAFETTGPASRARIRRRSGPDPGPCSTPTSGAGPPSCLTSSFRRADRGLAALVLGQGLGCDQGPGWVRGQGLIGGTRSTPRASTPRAPRGGGSPWSSSSSRNACAERSRGAIQ